jgi:hypothetical protein
MELTIIALVTVVVCTIILGFGWYITRPRKK